MTTTIIPNIDPEHVAAFSEAAELLRHLTAIVQHVADRTEEAEAAYDHLHQQLSTEGMFTGHFGDEVWDRFCIESGHRAITDAAFDLADLAARIADAKPPA